MSRICHTIHWQTSRSERLITFSEHCTLLLDCTVTNSHNIVSSLGILVRLLEQHSICVFVLSIHTTKTSAQRYMYCLLCCEFVISSHRNYLTDYKYPTLFSYSVGASNTAPAVWSVVHFRIRRYSSCDEDNRSSSYTTTPCVWLWEPFSNYSTLIFLSGEDSLS